MLRPLLYDDLIVVVVAVAEVDHGAVIAMRVTDALEILGNLDSGQSRPITAIGVLALAANQAAPGNYVGTIGVLEGTILSIEHTAQNPGQIDGDGDDGLIAAGVLHQADALLTGDLAAVLTLGGSELICKAAQFIGETIDLGIDDHAGIAGLALVDQMLGILLQPDIGARHSGILQAGLDSDHLDLALAQELFGNTQDVLFHVLCGDVPGALAGNQIHRIEHRSGLSQHGQLTLDFLTQRSFLDVGVCHC